MKKLSFALLLISTPTFAQDVTFNLTVTNADVLLIGKGLGSLPYNDVASLMNKLQLQINQQQQKAVDKPKEEKHD